MAFALRMGARMTAGMRVAAPVRALSTAPIVKSGLVSPGIQLYGLDGRYAHALFSAASKSSTLGTVEKELIAIKGSIESDVAFSNFLASPVLNESERVDSVTKIMKAWKVTDTTLNFFITLARNNRLDHSSGMIGAFNTLMSSSRNEVVCTITSAVELTSAIQGNLKKSLAAFAPGQAINFQTVVDPDIIGGVIVEIGGDKYIDMSTRTKVNKLVKELSAPI